MKNVIDISKITIGFETLPDDQLIQMRSYGDPLNPVPTHSPDDREHGIYYDKCKTNITRDNLATGFRCGAPTLSQ